MGHDHRHDLTADANVGPVGRRLKVAGAALLLLAALGLVVLWPRGDAPDLGVQPQEYVDGTVTTVTRDRCAAVETIGDVACRVIEVDITSGTDDGQTGFLTVVETQIEVPALEPGDEIVLRDVPTAPEEFRYGFHDFQRTPPLVWLGVLFVVVVVAFGRWQGLRALLGLALGALVLVAFLVPALLRDGPAVLVALTAAVAVAGLALYLAHGFTAATTVALFGTVASLLLVTLLAVGAVGLAQLSGLANQEAQVLSVTAGALDLRGLLVAGIVVGALGSLDDVTVTQVSTVVALRRANRSLGPLALYREAIRVGRDHVASSVNTLVLAYAGASLPLLLFFAQGTQPATRVVTGELVAVEVVRMLVGSIGLVASVPLTTALAAWVLSAPPRISTTRPSTPMTTGSRPDRWPQGSRWEDFGPDPAAD